MATAQKAKPGQKQSAPANEKSVATRAGTGLMREADVPDYIKKGRGRGNEEVSTSDVLIPRIELVQALSPCIDKNDPAYIEGAEQGMFFNSVSRELYGERVTVVPVFFQKQYLVWKDRKKGGGFRGAHNSAVEAAARIAEEPEKDRADFEAQETAQQLVIVIKEDGSTEEAVISMARTKLKVSKQLNSMIRMAGGDRFSRQYDIFGVQDSNDRGEKYWNIGITPNGFPHQEAYQKAEALYEAIASGHRKVNVDVDGADADADSGDRKGSGEY
jgi:hypothetical protein